MKHVIILFAAILITLLSCNPSEKPTPITDQQRLEAGIDADPFAQDASDD